MRVFLLKTGVYIVEFNDAEARVDILEAGPWTFDNKPLIVKPWSVEANLERMTAEQKRLVFARVIVEIKVGVDMPEVVLLQDEDGARALVAGDEGKLQASSGNKGSEGTNQLLALNGDNVSEGTNQLLALNGDNVGVNTMLGIDLNSNDGHPGVDLARTNSKDGNS
ncbi:hypothetical protein LguiB_012707 [Lonicera macranthoides]